MPTQKQIEDAAGIDDAVALHMMKQGTANARAAMAALSLACALYEAGAAGILKAAVDACRKEMGQ